MEKIRESFRFLAEQPGAGHVREDLTEDPAVRFWTVFSYSVAYAHAEQPLHRRLLWNGKVIVDTHLSELDRVKGLA